MPIYKSVYEPREDSKLLERYVRQYARGSVLDMGTGSGIQAITAAHNKKVNSVLATDVQEEVIDLCNKNIKNKKIRFSTSNLFENIKTKKFDTIIFNPPYLPNELKVKDLTLEGGKKGYEVLEKFLNQVNNFLKSYGIVLIVFSSLTKKNKIDEFIKKKLLGYTLLEKRHIFFEDLFVYKINKTKLLKELEKKNIININYFSKGKRGFIFTGQLIGKNVAIKIKNPETKAITRIENEIKFLKLLNKKNIGPKLLFHDKDFFVYEFVDGIYFADFLEKKSNNKKTILKMIKTIFDQLFVMDKLKINKEEMSHPIKHILINKKNKPILIDFERCRYTQKPGNVTQFCDFLMSKNIVRLLKIKKILINNKKIIKLAKNYKRNQNKNNLNKIFVEIK